MLEKILAEHGLPFDLRELGAEPSPATTREVISLPLALARAVGRPTIVYLDELQRVADYADGETFVYAELDLEAIFEPLKGEFKASATLASSSYVLTKDAHLTGGFAF